MLVYGDGSRRVDPRRVVAELVALAETTRAGATHSASARHDALTSLFVALGELVQGLADEDFAEHGSDRHTPLVDAALARLMRVARAHVRSPGALGANRPTRDAGASFAFDLQALLAHPLPPKVTLKTPEGFAFYAVYPEAYARAARDSALGRGAVIVGLRSIGASLACIVAAATRARAPITVRPVGPPHARTLRLGPALAAELAARAREPSTRFAVVDEGPGLSGSSFEAAASALGSLGVDARRLVFFPSHPGPPGPRSTPAIRRRFASVERRCVELDAIAFGDVAPEHGLVRAVAELVGEPIAHLEHLSGGAWRAALDEADWPPVDSWRERRKFLAHAASGPLLMKFSGLGRS